MRVSMGSQTITFTSTAPANRTVGGPTYTPTATATSGLPVTVTIDASRSRLLDLRRRGELHRRSAPASSTPTRPATPTTTPLPRFSSPSPALGTQTITFTSTRPSRRSSEAPTPSRRAAGPVATRSPSRSTPRRRGAARISGATVTFVAVGTCVIDANQAGNANYEAATQIQQSFAGRSAPRRITFTSTPPSPAVVGGTYTVDGERRGERQPGHLLDRRLGDWELHASRVPPSPSSPSGPASSTPTRPATPTTRPPPRSSSPSPSSAPRPSPSPRPRPARRSWAAPTQ